MVHHIAQKRLNLHEYYPSLFSPDQKYNKYWAASSSEDIYDFGVGDSGWTLLELPFECFNICLGNKIVLFHTRENRLLLNRNVVMKCNSSDKLAEIFKQPEIVSGVCPFFVIDERKLVDISFELNSAVDVSLKCYEIFRVACDASNIFIEMVNGLVITLATEPLAATVDTRFVHDRIKLLATSGQSSKVVFYTESHKLYINEKPVSLDQITTSPIKLITASPVCTAFVTQDNEFYINGDDSNGTCGGIQTGATEYKLALKQFSEQIVDLRCGYIHTVVILESGKIWASGYNDLKQCCQEGSVPQFKEVDDRYYKFHAKQIRSTSRGTVLMTNSEAVFIGEVVHKFSTYKDKMQVETFTNEFTDVACGGWQYILYNPVKKSSKSMIYYFNNLKKLTAPQQDTEAFSDVLLL